LQPVKLTARASQTASLFTSKEEERYQIYSDLI